MFIYDNPHPKGKKVGDCVKRAICLVSEVDYMVVQRQLNRYKKETGAAVYNEKRNWQPFIEKFMGGKKISFPAQKGFSRMDGYRFCEEYPKGRYILNMAGHLTCCIDGAIHDTWDCRHKCVYNAWEV